MNIFSPYEHYVWIGIAVYYFIALILFIRAHKIKENGIIGKASILSVVAQEHDTRIDHLDAAVNSTSHKANIEYKTKDGKLLQSTIQISGKYLSKGYKNKLPIIYHRKNKEKVIINDNGFIYQLPIGMFLISLLVAPVLIYFLLGT